MSESMELNENAGLTAYQRVKLARDIKRPRIDDYIDVLFEDFVELKGDRIGSEDAGILGGIATFHGIPVTVIGHRKGKNLEENMRYNFGMPEPQGYRKALRLMKQAEKFNRPIITFIDTPGAYPGIAAEENGQSVAIAENLAKMSCIEAPIIAVVTGEGSSGGALAIGVANTILMLENAVYSVLSPEGFASILWKDSARSSEACDLMKLTAKELFDYALIDGVIPEPEGGIQNNVEEGYAFMDDAIFTALKKLRKNSGAGNAKARYKKFRNIDAEWGKISKN